MTYEFRHQAMHTDSEWTVLEQNARAKNSGARQLDSRTIAALYADAIEKQWDETSRSDQSIAEEAIAVRNRKWLSIGCTATQYTQFLKFQWSR